MSHRSQRTGLVRAQANRGDVPGSTVEQDRFEGEMYARQAVSIEMYDGGRLTAETYIVRPEYVDRLEEAEWDFSEFLCNGKSSFGLDM